MKNGKNIKNIFRAILAIIFVVLAVALLTSPTAKSQSFWTALIFTAIAFAAQVLIWKKAFGKTGTMKSKFVGLPIVFVGIVYLVVQIAVLVLFFTRPTLPTWSAVVLCTAILGIFAILIISAEISRGEIAKAEVQTKKASRIKELAAEVETLSRKEGDPATKLALEKLAEKFRASDPVSPADLADLEASITAKVAELKNLPDKLKTAGELDYLLTERNKKCKASK
jgi:hypothetical protein